jgi:hypothetical protein
MHPVVPTAEVLLLWPWCQHIEHRIWRMYLLCAIRYRNHILIHFGYPDCNYQWRVFRRVMAFFRSGIHEVVTAIWPLDNVTYT